MQSYIRGLSEVFGNNYSYWVQMEACQIISESNIMVHGASIMILLTEIIIDLPPSEPNTCSYFQIPQIILLFNSCLPQELPPI